MASIKPTITDVSQKGDGSALVAQWTPVTEADSCVAVQYPDHINKSIQVTGTFGSASVALNGSNDGANYAALTAPGGTAIGISAAGLKAVVENTRLVQPSPSGGSSQSLTITMLLQMPNPMRT